MNNFRVDSLEKLNTYLHVSCWWPQLATSSSVWSQWSVQSTIFACLFKYSLSLRRRFPFPFLFLSLTLNHDAIMWNLVRIRFSSFWLVHFIRYGLALFGAIGTFSGSQPAKLNLNWLPQLPSHSICPLNPHSIVLKCAHYLSVFRWYAIASVCMSWALQFFLFCSSCLYLTNKWGRDRM